MSGAKRNPGQSSRTTHSRNTRAESSSSPTDVLEVHRRVARTSAARLLQTPASSFAIVFVIAVSLLLPAILFNLNGNIDTLLSNFEETAQLTLYLRDDVSDTLAQDVSNNLLTREDIKNVIYISSAQALEEFGAATGLQNLLQQMPNNPLPGAIVVTPVDPSPGPVDALLEDLQKLAEVDTVQVDSRWLQRLAAISTLVQTVGRVLSLIVIVGLFFVVGNTIKLAVENRKAEIRVIKLVGGTDMFAARPFLYTGLFFGMAGGLLACVLQAIVLVSFNTSLETLMRLYESDFQLQGFGLPSSLFLVVAGALIGWSAALLASLRHIRSINP